MSLRRDDTGGRSRGRRGYEVIGSVRHESGDRKLILQRGDIYGKGDLTTVYMGVKKNERSVIIKGKWSTNDSWDVGRGSNP